MDSTRDEADDNDEKEKDDEQHYEGFDSDDDTEPEDKTAEELKNEYANVTQLSESIFIYPNRKISDHGNVFEGEIRSGVYGVRVCAIKFARKADQNVREAKILTKLGSHTHVISIIESGIYKDMFDERVYIALDKCHEENLHQHITHQIESRREDNLNEALEYSKQIIAGVVYVHDNLIIHKDLKPSNILISNDKSTIKLADFGLSQEIKSKSSKVYSKHQFGTYGYRPIESFGNNWVSLKSDIFSLGVVLYFVLSNGKSPFGDEISLWSYNMQNGLTDLSHLLTPNANKFQHLIELTLCKERCRRPSIWQVADHPCWTEKSVECNFYYGYVDETDDSDVKILDQCNQDSTDSESEMESRQQLLRVLYNNMGYNASPNPEISIIIFDDNTQHLRRFNLKNKSLAPMHEFNDDMKTKRRFSSVSFRDHIYILMKSSFYRLNYTDATARWERMPDLTNNHGLRPPAVAVSGTIYVAGSSAVAATNSVSKYDFSSNSWEKLKDKHLSTWGASVVTSKKCVYCIGGYAEGFDVTDRVERMNFDSQTWDDIAPMRKARREASAVECNGKIFVAGGGRKFFSLIRILDSVEKYDPDVNQWTVMKPMKEGRFNFQCHYINGNIYAVGGERTTIERYDVAKNEWEFFHELKAEMFCYDSVTVKSQ